MKMFSSFLLGIVLSAAFTAHSAETVSHLTLSNGIDVPIKVYTGTGKNLFLWLPSEWGLRGRENDAAESLRGLGHSVWIADLHTAYFEPEGRSSLENIPTSDMTELIDSATRATKGKVYVLSAGRGAALSLLAIREWQIANAGLAGVGGAVFFYPNLSEGPPLPGGEPRFSPIASLSNLPVYIYQPALAARFWQLDRLRDKLGAGGSQVYSHVLKDVSDGFDLRTERNPIEKQTAKKLPQLISSAIKVLGFHSEEEFPPVTSDMKLHAPESGQLSVGLQVYQGKQRTHELRLKSVGGNTIDIKDYKGQVVLLNFWTTWCPPCVKELPSLNRLQKRMVDRPFKVLGVDVAESEQVVGSFLKNVKVDFPILLDTEGDTVHQWKLLAFPMSFLLGPDGEIKYGYYGALEWDTDEVVAIVEGLLKQ